jgi:hypothetical protein
MERIERSHRDGRMVQALRLNDIGGGALRIEHCHRVQHLRDRRIACTQ